MPKGIKVCKVCGAEYPYCRTENRGNRFRYQDVACCQEHGSIYFRKVAESRKDVETKESECIVNDFSDLFEDEEDELFEEDFEDDEDDEQD